MQVNFLSLICITFLFCIKTNGQIVVKTANGYDIVDAYDGELMTKHSYPFIDKPSGDLCVMHFDGYFGYLNTNGRVEITNKYDLAYPFKNSFALVAKGNKYLYINDKGDEFGDMSWPKAPITFKEFLVLDDSISTIVHKNGETVLRTSNQIITTPLSGIFEWNQDSSWVKQHIMTSNNGKLREANHFKNVTNVAPTWQGYACIEFDSTFSIYNDRGELIFANQPKQSYYLPVKVLWHDYLYLPDRHRSIPFENHIHREPMYYADNLYRENGRNVYGPSVLLAEGFEQEDIALIRGTEKWAIFDRSDQNIEGSYLFDEVLPSDDEELLIVRQEMEWYVYSKRMDTLLTTGFRFVHHRGLVDGWFFGSSDHGTYDDKKWSLNYIKREFSDLKIEISNDELYQFPRAYYNSSGYDNPQIFRDTESDELLFLLRDNKTVLIRQGNELYQEDTSSNGHLNFDDFFMPEFYLHRKNIQPLENKNGLKRNKIGLYLEANGQNLQIVLANTTKESILLQHYDKMFNEGGNIENGIFEIYLEYEKAPGIWQEFTRFEGDNHGGGLIESTELPANHKLNGKMILAKGPLGPQYNIRARLMKKKGEILYSNTVMMSLCPSLLYGNPYFKKYGASSKYQLLTE